MIWIAAGTYILGALLCTYGIRKQVLARSWNPIDKTEAPKAVTEPPEPTPQPWDKP